VNFYSAKCNVRDNNDCSLAMDMTTSSVVSDLLLSVLLCTTHYSVTNVLSHNLRTA